MCVLFFCVTFDISISIGFSTIFLSSTGAPGFTKWPVVSVSTILLHFLLVYLYITLVALQVISTPTLSAIFSLQFDIFIVSSSA